MKFSCPTLPTVCWIVGYLLTLGAIFYGLTTVRQRQLSSSDTQLENSWQQWRDAAAIQAAGNGPVKRKVPKSTLPPIQVLFADHYMTITLSAIFFGSFLYGMLYFFARGILAGDRGNLSGIADQDVLEPALREPPD